MRLARLSVALQLLLVFVSGSVVGGLAYRFYIHQTDPVEVPKRPPDGPRQFRQRFMEEMRSRLKLRPDQAEKLEQIMDLTRQRFGEAKQRQDGAMKAIYDDQVRQIRAILDPAQQLEYDKIRQEREQARARALNRSGKEKRRP